MHDDGWLRSNHHSGHLLPGPAQPSPASLSPAYWRWGCCSWCWCYLKSLGFIVLTGNVNRTCACRMIFRLCAVTVTALWTVNSVMCWLWRWSDFRCSVTSGLVGRWSGNADEWLLRWSSDDKSQSAWRMWLSVRAFIHSLGQLYKSTPQCLPAMHVFHVTYCNAHSTPWLEKQQYNRFLFVDSPNIHWFSEYSSAAARNDLNFAQQPERTLNKLNILVMSELQTSLFHALPVCNRFRTVFLVSATKFSHIIHIIRYVYWLKIA